MLCSLDWTALGTWALVLVTGGAVAVAYTQLRLLNKSEQLKNTLELLRRYDTVPVTFMHEGKTQTLTPVQAYARAVSPENLAFFKVYNVSQGLNADYRLRWASIVVAVNYFKSAGALWERHVLENDLLFGYIAPQIVRIFEVFKELNAMRGQPTIKYGLGDFAEAAQAFLDKQAKDLDLGATVKDPS